MNTSDQSSATSTAAANASGNRKEEFARRLRYLFFFYRRPDATFEPQPDIPKWERNPDAWRDFIQLRLKKSSSFLSDEALRVRGIDPGGTIATDIDTLNKYLVGPYIEEDYQALWRQNQYFLFQWRFTLLALCATVSASFVVMLSTNPELRIWSIILGLMTTAFGAFTSLFADIYNRERPQRKWFERRRVAEQLRKHYFIYLAHMSPYDGENHVFVLKKMVDAIRLQQNTRVQHTAQETEQLIKLYEEFRVEAQATYYRRRGDEYDYNFDATLLMAWAIPLVVAFMSSVNAVLVLVPAMPNSIVSVMAAIIVILPSFAAAILSFQRIYDWERQLQLYGKTVEGINSARIYDEMLTNKRLILVDLVTKTEQVLGAEADQWGAPLSEPDQDITAEQIFDSFLRKTNMDENTEFAQQVRAHLNIKTPPTPPAIAPVGEATPGQ
jgi:ABC-type multidrug transport system fused ATPase/permease subunit